MKILAICIIISYSVVYGQYTTYNKRPSDMTVRELMSNGMEIIGELRNQGYRLPWEAASGYRTGYGTWGGYGRNDYNNYGSSKQAQCKCDCERQSQQQYSTSTSSGQSNSSTGNNCKNSTSSQGINQNQTNRKPEAQSFPNDISFLSDD